MPIIAYECDRGHIVKKFFRHPEKAPSDVACQPSCDKLAKKQLSAPAQRSIVIVDNGNARSVEVNLELVEDVKERSTKDFREK